MPRERQCHPSRCFGPKRLSSSLHLVRQRLLHLCPRRSLPRLSLSRRSPRETQCKSITRELHRRPHSRSELHSRSLRQSHSRLSPLMRRSRCLCLSLLMDDGRSPGRLHRVQLVESVQRSRQSFFHPSPFRIVVNVTPVRRRVACRLQRVACRRVRAMRRRRQPGRMTLQELRPAPGHRCTVRQARSRRLTNLQMLGGISLVQPLPIRRAEAR